MPGRRRLSRGKPIHDYLDSSLHPSRRVGGFEHGKDFIESGRWSSSIASSNVASVRYAKGDRILQVLFIGNPVIYSYFLVEVFEALELYYANSVGRFVAKRIKGIHSFRRKI